LGQDGEIPEGIVNPYLAVSALVGVVGTMTLLPLIPALIELRRKSDAAPLNVIQQHAGEIRYFAQSFRSYMQELEPVLRQCAASGTNASGVLPHGDEYVALGRGDGELLQALAERDATHPVVIVAGVDLLAPAATTFSREVFSSGRFLGGEKSNYRAILAEREVHLGASSCVMRWVHAVGPLTAERGCKLYGRASSDAAIRLHADCSFLRLNAPRIEIGEAANPSVLPATSPADLSPQTTHRFFHDGDFEIQPDEVIRGNLVVRGRLRIGSGARVSGSVKSTKDMTLENGVAIAGSLISAQGMRIGRDCAVHGPVIAEHAIFIAAETCCGNAQNPTTVSAPEIEIEEGAQVFGTLWARESGRVVLRT